MQNGKFTQKIDSGTATSTSALKLIDSGQDFLSYIEPGYTVHNTTDNTTALVLTVDSNIQLTLDTDTMADTEAYIIYTSSDKLGDYTFDSNYEVPYNENPKFINERKNRMVNGSLSIKFGTLKYSPQLAFIDIDTTQKDNLLTFVTSKSFFRYYPDSEESTFYLVWCDGYPSVIETHPNSGVYNVTFKLNEV